MGAGESLTTFSSKCRVALLPWGIEAEKEEMLTRHGSKSDGAGDGSMDL
jgi:hypothetical protein